MSTISDILIERDQKIRSSVQQREEEIRTKTLDDAADILLAAHKDYIAHGHGDDEASVYHNNLAQGIAMARAIVLTLKRI